MTEHFAALDRIEVFVEKNAGNFIDSCLDDWQTTAAYYASLLGIYGTASEQMNTDVMGPFGPTNALDDHRMTAIVEDRPVYVRIGPHRIPLGEGSAEALQRELNNDFFRHQPVLTQTAPDNHESKDRELMPQTWDYDMTGADYDRSAYPKKDVPFPQNRPDAPILSRCAACLDSFDAAATVTVPCACAYCFPCLIILIKTACATKATFPPRCHNQVIGADKLDCSILDDMAHLYMEKKNEYAETNPLYCANASCSIWIPQDTIDTKTNTATCSACATTTCSVCRLTLTSHAKHCGRCPDADMYTRSGVKALAEAEGWTRCPQCRYVIEKTDGCDHMDCLCGCEFCYACGETLEYEDNDGDCACARYVPPPVEGQAPAQGNAGQADEVVWEAQGEDDDFPDHLRAIGRRGNVLCAHVETEAVYEDDGGAIRCHGCLVEFERVGRCLECSVELCDGCREPRTRTSVATQVDWGTGEDVGDLGAAPDRPAVSNSDDIVTVVEEANALANLATASAP